MTVLDDLIPKMIDMARAKTTGTINLTNPGCISHNEVLELYKKYHDPDITWSNFSEEEQNEILASKRSNNLLNTHKLESMYPDILNISDSLTHTFKNYNA
jgi:3,5-epimerase/4-reductase